MVMNTAKTRLGKSQRGIFCTICRYLSFAAVTFLISLAEMLLVLQSRSRLRCTSKKVNDSYAEKKL
jgi:hypothetical protein